MWSRFTQHLYVRIWLAVLATVLVLTFLVGAAWQFTRNDDSVQPIREVLVHNAAGQVIGTAQTSADHKRGDDLAFQVNTHDGQTLYLLLPRPAPPPSTAPWGKPPFGFGWMLVVVGLAVALGAYPVVRRLTLHLEALQRGVERWGAGDLSTRLDDSGNDEVAFLARRFNHAAERIETLMDSHRSLLANASHELRSPLARIRMGLELMGGEESAQAARLARAVAETLPTDLQEAPRAPAKRGYSARDEISRSINELDQLIDEILLASRLDARQADAEPFETVDLLGLAAEECARVKADLSLGFVADSTCASAGETSGETAEDVTVQGSARLLRRLLRNLLENARRYGNGDICLELGHIQRAAHGRVVLKVHDRGPGVPAAQRERIFEPFYRLPGASEREGGVGLGLALVKSISARHGGTVRCESRPGGGASFVVELPAIAQGAARTLSG